MGQGKALDNPLESVKVRRLARARRMTLRVSRIDGQVTLTMPPTVPDREARAFLDAQTDWIATARQKVAPNARLDFGMSIPIEGIDRKIVATMGRSARIFDDRIEAPNLRAVLARVKGLARERIVASVDVHAPALGRSVKAVTLRDTRSRWGSCTADGRIMVSWRLILAPPEALDYVVAHEVAHLVEMNHSRAFWEVVERLRPDYQQWRRWLRTEGPALHRFRFD